MNQQPNNMNQQQNFDPTMSSIGNLKQNVAALLAYLSSVLLGFFGAGMFAFAGPLVIFLLEKRNMFVKRHAAQALALSIFDLITSIIFSVVGLNIYNMINFNSNNPLSGFTALTGVFLVISFILGAVNITVFIFRIIAMVKANNNLDYDIPVIGKISKSFVK